MDEIKIPKLNERARLALAERLANTSSRLHGVLPPCPKPGIVQVLWPYGEVLRALDSNDRSRCDDVFFRGSCSLPESLSCYLRCCQLLGLSVCRLEQKLLNDREELQAHKGVESWSMEVDLEAAYGEFHSSVDVVIHLDSCVSYLKILADGVAKTMSSVFEDQLSPSRDSMNRLWNDALKRPGTSLERVLSSTKRDWLDILSTARSKPAGIRDARVHHGAWNVPMGYAEGDGPISVVIQQSSIGKERVGNIPGETIWGSIDHSRDMVSDLIASTRGFFSFLDHVVREAVAQYPALTPANAAYSKSGYVLAFGPSEFLGSVLPSV